MDSDAGSQKADLRGPWIPYLGLLLSFAPRYFAYIDFSSRKDNSSLWMYIGRDFNHGIGSLVGLFLSLILFVIMRKRCHYYSIMMLWMTVLWSYPAAQATTIALKCKNILSPLNAISFWPTPEEYIHSKGMGSPALLITAFISGLIIVIDIFYRRKTKKGGESLGEDNILAINCLTSIGNNKT